MRSLLGVAVLVALLGLADAAGAGGPDAPGGEADGARSVTVGGSVRHYLIHLPPDHSDRAPMPLVIALHAAGSSAAEFRRYAGLDRIADREGFAVAYPE